MAQTFKEVPAELLHKFMDVLTGDNAVLLSSGNIDLYSSAVASCRFISELTFKKVAACFIRPQKHVLRIIDRNEHFTLSYFPLKYRYILDFFGSKSNAAVNATIENIKPMATESGNIFYPQSELVIECRKISNLELILSKEVQSIMSNEKRREIYPGGEAPRMYIGEVQHFWMKVGDQRLLNK